MALMVYLQCQKQIRDSDPGVDIQLKIGTVIVEDRDPDWNPSLSPCNGNSTMSLTGLESESVSSNVNKPCDRSMHGPYWRWLYVQTFILPNDLIKFYLRHLVTTYLPLTLKSTPVMGALWPRREQTSHGCENACFDSFFFSNRCFFPAPFCFFAACALLFVSFTSTN